MYEYTLTDNKTGEIEIIFGYDLKDAVRRSQIDMSNYNLLFSEYVD